MSRAWRLLTGRGRGLLAAGVLVVVASMLTGQRDVMRIGLLLGLLPVVALVIVIRAGLRMSCERAVEPARVALGESMRGRIVLGQQGRLPAAVVLLEDSVPRELGVRPRFLATWAGGGRDGRQRTIGYPLHGRVRGRFRTGPLVVRTTDAFGLARLDRQFAATSEVMVTPKVVELPQVKAGGGVGSSGEARPHRIGVVGQDDVLVREYRPADDVRRIHWRSTARLGELMVRREEQAWDPSASVLLDSRAAAHAGRGMHSSLEWAVSAAASIAIHYLDDGFGVEIYEADGPLQVGGGPLGQHATTSRELVLSRLTDLRARPTRTLQYAVQAASVDRPGQLVVAVLGRMSVDDAQALLRLRHNRASGVALLLDVDSFADEPAGDGVRRAHELAGQLLWDNQWRVVEVTRGMSVSQAWSAWNSQLSA